MPNDQPSDGSRLSWRFGLLAVGCLLGIVVLVSPARASRTGLWEFSDIESWLQGTFKGTGLTSEGHVIPTLSTDATDVPARLVWDARSSSRGTLIATSLPATVMRRDPSDGTMHRILKTEDLGLTAMARVSGTVYAAATPSGRIFRYDPQSDAMVRVATLADSYVWSLQPDRRGRGLYVGTGPEGRLYHLDPDGSVEALGQVPGHNVLSLAWFRDRLYLGDDFGGLYRLDDEGNPRSVYGFKNGEVAALTSNERYLYVGVNLRQTDHQKQTNQKDASELARQLREESLQSQSTPAVSSRGDSPRARPQSSRTMIEAVRSQALERASRLFEGLSGTLVYRMDPPERMNIVYNDDAEIVHDLAATEDSLYVATGGKGRLYRIREDFTRQAYFKGKHRLVLSVGLKDGRPERMTTGEGGALVTRRPSDRVRYRYRSPVLDAQLLSRWGRITSRAEGTIRIRTRSGNTAQPDNSWSDWSAWKNAESMSIVSPPARFIQVEVAFGGPDASLRQLEIAYRVPNQRPRISQLSVSPNPLRERLFRSRSVSGNGSAGSRSSGSSNTSSNSSSGSPKQRQVNWNIVDPDGDPHRVRLFYRRLGESRWISFTGDQPVSEDHYTVNLQNLADGQYEIRLVATDRPFNDPGKGFKVEKTAGPMLVDNTAPGLRDWSVEGPRVSFRVVDETSRIVFAQYRVNGGPWNGLMPEDGIYDQTRERFQFSLTDRSPQEGDVLEVRTMDESGNLTTTRHSFR